MCPPPPPALDRVKAHEWKYQNPKSPVQVCWTCLKAHEWKYQNPKSPVQVCWTCLKAGPLEAILVILGRRALIFWFESSWKKMKNDATYPLIFVRMHSSDHLGDAKMSKKGTSLRRI